MPGAVESLLSLAGLGFDDEPTTTAAAASAATTRSVATSLGKATTTTAAAVVTTLTERTTRTTEAVGTRSSVIGPVENTAGRTSCESLSGRVWV